MTSIIADKNSNPDWIASDLIAQAEHDIFSQSILITNSLDLIKSVNLSLKLQLKNLPKKQIASQSLKNFGLAIYSNNACFFVKFLLDSSSSITAKAISSPYTYV